MSPCNVAAKYMAESMRNNVTRSDKPQVVAWKRVIAGMVLFFLLIQVVYFFLTLARLEYLPALLDRECGLVNPDPVCVAGAVELLLFAPEWQAVKFVVYFVLGVTMLWLLFRRALGLPFVNLSIVGVVSGCVFLLTAEPVGIEPLACFVIAVFTGLLIIRSRRRRVIFNSR